MQEGRPVGAAGSVGLVESLPWWEPIVCVCPVILNSSSVVFQKFSQAWGVCLETSTLGLNGIAPHGWGERKRFAHLLTLPPSEGKEFGPGP